EINKAYKNIITLLTQHDPDVIFNIANSIWYADNCTVEQHFIDINQNYFNAEVEALNFQDPNSVNIINNWVNEKTNGKIEQIIDSIPPEVIMYLINAIYFNGTWTSEFNEEETYNGIFYLPDNTEKTTPFMVQTNDFLYNDTNDVEVIELPYGNGDFRMTILLPHTEVDFDSFLLNLNSEEWNILLNGLTEQHGTIILPKIQLKYKIKLKQALQDLGMGIAFSGAADFTKINQNGGIFIDEVLHKTYLKINEEGTEAAAVTCTSLGFGVADLDFTMNVNRPYIFAIRENSSKTILFLGKITNPEWED
ncbi:MAG: serpin family protein, partial [Calditrichia bacterium]|nr:serpin family protein [Calditrichia bacterium]